MSKPSPRSRFVRWWKPGALSSTWRVQADASPVLTSLGRHSPYLVFAMLKKGGSAAEDCQAHQVGPSATTLRMSPECFQGNLTSQGMRCSKVASAISAAASQSHARSSAAIEQCAADAWPAGCLVPDRGGRLAQAPRRRPVFHLNACHPYLPVHKSYGHPAAGR